MITSAWLGIKLYSAGYRRSAGASFEWELFEKDRPGLESKKVYLVDLTGNRRMSENFLEQVIAEAGAEESKPFGGSVLLLALTVDPFRMKEFFLGHGFHSFWLLDANSSTLIVNDTVDDFDDLKKILIRSLQTVSPDTQPGFFEAFDDDLTEEKASRVKLEPEELPAASGEVPPVKNVSAARRRSVRSGRRSAPSENDFLRYYILRMNGILILINLLVFLINEILVLVNPVFDHYMGALRVTDIFEPRYYYHFLTAAFVHFGIRHLVGNMTCLFFVGPVLEDALGKWKYLLTYLVSAVLANVFSVLVYIAMNRINVRTAGASGGVFAVMGGVLGAMLCKRTRLEGSSATKMAVVIVYMLVSGFASSKGVNNSAHVVGALFGFVISFLILAAQEHFRELKRNKKYGGK